MVESSVLREGQNSVEIVGKVKRINLEEKTSTRTGKDYISGTVVVEVREDNRVSNLNVRVFSNKLKNNGEINGLYKGYKTVKDEFQVGDLIKVNGSLRLEEFYNQQGTLTSFNSVSATFFNRLKEEERQKAIATLEVVVENFTPESDSEGLPTGRMLIDAFNVGYNGRIIPLQNLVISEELYKPFKTMYFPGNTGRITLKINNYAELEKTEVEEVQTGFGSSERAEENVITNYVSELEIIGGDLPYDDGVNDYSPQDIEQAHKNRELALQQLKQQYTATSEPTGFGNSGNVNENTNREQELNKALLDFPQVTSDDIPDF